MTEGPNDALRNQTGLFRLVVNNLQEYAIFTIDHEGRVATWNDGAERVLGYREAEIVGQPASIIFVAEDREADVPQQEMQIALDQERAQDERWHVKKNGERFWANGVMQSLRDDDGKLIGFVKIIRDETERKQYEDTLRTLNQTLENQVVERTARVRHLAQALRVVEEQERRRLAERLHDHLQQILVAVKLKLGSLIGQLNQGDVRQAVEEAEGLLEDSIQESRSITVELSPPQIPRGGLESSLQWLARWLEQRSTLKVHVHVETEAEPATEELRAFLHRAARELLTNIVKHANTEEAWLTLKRADRHVRMTVEDRGKGFDASKLPNATAPTSYGLRSLYERCELIGGEMQVNTAPGQGTRIAITLPVEPT